MVEPRRSAPTLKFVDEYCQLYQNLFPEVRNFEAFKYLHMGCVSDIKRKTLPEIAEIVWLDNHQALHDFFNINLLECKRIKKAKVRINFIYTSRSPNSNNY